jgi:hypothetical protein
MTQGIERCQTSARSVQLVELGLRAAKLDARMEAINSRPLLLAGVGRAVKHAGQTALYLTAKHAAGQHIMTLIANIRATAYQGCCREKKCANDLSVFINPPKRTGRWIFNFGYRIGAVNQSLADDPE